MILQKLIKATTKMDVKIDVSSKTISFIAPEYSAIVAEFHIYDCETEESHAFTANSEQSDSNVTFDLPINIEYKKLIRRIILTANGEKIFDSGLLFYINNDEFRDNFISLRLRPKENSLISFISYQALIGFEGETFFKVSFFPILIYKKCEGHDIGLTEAEFHLFYLNCLDACKEIKYNTHPRKNGEHLFISCVLSYLHLLILYKNSNQIELIQCDLKNIINAPNNYFTIGFNLSKIICLYALIAIVKGNKSEFENLLNECVQVYQYSVKDLRCEIVLFNELAESHKAVIKLLKISNALNKGESINNEIKECFMTFCRLLNNKDLLFKNFNEIYCE